MTTSTTTRSRYGSKFVILPKLWVDANHIEVGDEVEFMMERNGTLNDCPTCQRGGFPPRPLKHGNHDPVWNYNMFTHISTCRICGKTKIGMP